MTVVGVFSGIARAIAEHPLTCDAQLRAWGRYVSWQLRSRMQDQVVIPWIGGQKLIAQKGMTGATPNLYFGLHEFCDMSLLLHFLRSSDMFLDVGSNIGSFTVLASGVCGATSWAFEPDPDNVAALKRNISLNGLENRVTVHEVAAGDKDGTVSFTRGMGTMNRIARSGEMPGRQVPIVKLDSLIGDLRPTMIKLDVEGHEEAVIFGARNILAIDSLKVIEAEDCTKPMDDLLTRHGFMRMYYDPFRRALTPSPNAYKASNILFVRDLDFVTARVSSAPPIEVLGASF